MARLSRGSSAEGPQGARDATGACRDERLAAHAARRATTAGPTGSLALSMWKSRVVSELGVGVGTIYRWLATGFITGTQLTPGAPWQIRLDDELRAKVTDEAPEGWLSLDRAAKVLGVARQTVLHKVQRGELAAVHVHHGRRESRRIQVEPAQVGLFAQA